MHPLGNAVRIYQLRTRREQKSKRSLGVICILALPSAYDGCWFIGTGDEEQPGSDSALEGRRMLRR